MPEDIVMKYMMLSAHLPDTLFIVHEGDFRLTRHSTRVSCFEKFPAEPADSDRGNAFFIPPPRLTSGVKLFTSQRKCLLKVDSISIIALRWLRLLMKLAAATLYGVVGTQEQITT